MRLIEIKQTVETSATFKEWKEFHPKAFLYLIFSMFEKVSLAVFEAAYYCPKEKKATIFVIDEVVLLKGEDEIFGDNVPAKLEFKNVKINMADALITASKTQIEKYPNEIPSKTIVMLQVIDKKTSWNLTLFTLSFSTLNIKIDAASGKVFDHSLSKLFDFVK